MFQTIKMMFPRRPLKIKYTGTSNWGMALFSLLWWGMFSYFAVAFIGPGIINDYKVSQSRQVPVIMNISNSYSCSKSLGFLVACMGTYKFESDGWIYGRPHADVWFDFFGNDIHTIEPVIAVGQRETITTHIAVEHIWQRIFLFSIIVLILLLWVRHPVRLVRQTLQGYKMRWQKQVLLPIEIRLGGYSTYYGFRSYSVSFTHPETGKRKSADLGLRPRERVIMLDEKQSIALGVIPKGGNLAILLDDELWRVDFSDEEHSALWKIVHRRASESKT